MESKTDAELVKEAEKALASLPSQPWYIDNHIISEGDTPGELHLYGSDFNDGPPVITALEYGEAEFRALAYAASLVPELARRLKAANEKLAQIETTFDIILELDKKAEEIDRD